MGGCGGVDGWDPLGVEEVGAEAEGEKSVCR